MTSIYFDHNATTALDSNVLDVMLPWMQDQNGNPTSRHVFGRSAREAVETARAQVAEACGAYASQVIFTSCGTEANNFAIKGMAQHKPASQILTSAIEHPCVSKPAQSMQAFGFKHQTIAVDKNGLVILEAFKEQVAQETGLVSIMLANNETGVIQEVAHITEIARSAGAFVHSDAVQGLGKIPVRFTDLNVHAMTVSSHKICGPQGVAALVVDKRMDIHPLLHGGGQERGLRSGTENIAAIVGFGLACEIAVANQKAYAVHTQALRDQFEQGLKALDVTIFADTVARIPNTSFFSVPGVEGETLVMALDRQSYAVASGSACSSDSTEPSHVLLAMGVDKDIALGAVRISFGLNNTLSQVRDFLTILKQEILRLRQLTAIAA